jgi:hypothetical protein
VDTGTLNQRIGAKTQRSGQHINIANGRAIEQSQIAASKSGNPEVHRVSRGGQILSPATGGNR